MSVAMLHVVQGRVQYWMGIRKLESLIHHQIALRNSRQHGVIERYNVPKLGI